MNSTQRAAVATAAYLVAIILFLFFFGHPLWGWATWDASRGTLDFGFVKITTRPPFPWDVKSVLAGLALPVVLAAFGRFVGTGGRK